MSLTYNYIDNYKEALLYAEKALLIWQELGNKVAEAQTLNSISTIYYCFILRKKLKW